MENTNEVEVRQAMIVDGHTLTIIASMICEDEWELSISNVHGISTNFCEFFESAADAIEAGRQAIEAEGVEEFIATEGFDYLQAHASPE